MRFFVVVVASILIIHPRRLLDLFSCFAVTVTPVHIQLVLSECGTLYALPFLHSMDSIFKSSGPVPFQGII